ncbi:hypothetical protein RvY_18795 [Ramazzottius varieornatus]|uniref:Acireductone dioxygenase n=1 Tax=Ramazzottius varieornatus TaxID=947166 RepID=A0A1D1W727_RAMVA|nr:hypothetical protein RvY_18795 [Ramazzottius varieornatus]
MVRMYYMRDPVDDKTAPNFADPLHEITSDELAHKTNVICLQAEVNESVQEEILNEITHARRCNFRDIIEISPSKMGDQSISKLDIFFAEHLHNDDEIRFIVEGSGYFDVRDRDDKWIRIAVEKGDLIVLPAGIYHRFTLDQKLYIKAMRLFVGEPVWTPYNRDDKTDESAARSGYLSSWLGAVSS